ncbi:sugar phosphate isomerase/epimerase family protein [Paralcaligenes ginsengisoli]
MSFSTHVIISLSSFGAAEVRRHGQAWFIKLCHSAGADGAEVRGELLVDPERELHELAGILHDTGLGCVYSSPDGLWDEAGVLNRPALEQGLAAAAILKAPVLKMSIGGFNTGSQASLSELGDRLGQGAVKLLIENDQTVSAGSVSALRRFFDAADRAGLALDMTFDMGNWHWLGESPLQAAELFAARVQYVHCKGVQRQPGRWVAVALADSVAPWRAVFNALPVNVPRAIEYPLFGDDLLGETRMAIQNLRKLEGDWQ